MVLKNKQVLLFSGFLPLIISACSGILYSSLGEDDIRATAYNIATTSLATTVEVTINAPESSDPVQPEATLNPVYCPEEELETWRQYALNSLISLSSQTAILFSDSVEAGELEIVKENISAQLSEVYSIKYPPCVGKAVQRLKIVYEEVIDTIDAKIEGNPATYPYEKKQFIQANYRLRRELNKLFGDAKFKDFKNIQLIYPE